MGYGINAVGVKKPYWQKTIRKIVMYAQVATTTIR
jgi:hypothetical protein